ncbi:hypothetical protein H8959_005046 [Pygathrix nigripes]
MRPSHPPFFLASGKSEFTACITSRHSLDLSPSVAFQQEQRRPNSSDRMWGDPTKVTYLGKVSTTGMQFLSGCTEKPVIELWKKHTLAREDVFPANALLEIRPFQVWLHHLDHKGEATVHMDTFQVARIAYCTADHNVSPNIFAWVYREINDDLSYQMDCHAVEVREQARGQETGPCHDGGLQEDFPQYEE